MGLRAGEARSLLVADLARGELTVKNSGTDTTKTRAPRRVLPVPQAVHPWLVSLAEGRPGSATLFESPRRKGSAIARTYPSQAFTRATGLANADRDDPIPRITVHGLRHTFAAIALPVAGADILSVSRAMGHARPSITLDRYGHLAPAGLGPLMAKIEALAEPFAA